MSRVILEKKDEQAAGSVPALERALDMLEALSGSPKGQTLTELGELLKINKNAVFRIAHTLVARGYLQRDEVSKKFRLTSELLRLGQPRVGDVSLSECAMPSLRSLRDEVGETTQLGIMFGDEGIVIDKIESKRAIRVGVDLGLRFPLHSNAPGKVLLAFRSPPEREQIIRRIQLERFTDHTITDKAVLRQECDRVVKQGYGTDDGEADEGINCVAAPICKRSQDVLAVIWVSSISGRLPRKRFPEIAARVVAAARAIEERLGE